MTEPYAFEHPIIQRLFHDELQRYANAMCNVFEAVQRNFWDSYEHSRRRHSEDEDAYRVKDIEGIELRFLRRIWGLNRYDESYSEYNPIEKGSIPKEFWSELRKESHTLCTNLENTILEDRQSLGFWEYTDFPERYVCFAYWKLQQDAPELQENFYLTAILHERFRGFGEGVYLRVVEGDIDAYVHQQQRAHTLKGKETRNSILFQNFAEVYFLRRDQWSEQGIIEVEKEKNLTTER